MENIIPGKSYQILANNWALLANVSQQIIFGNSRRVSLGFFASNDSARIFPNSTALPGSQIRPNLSNNGGLWYLYSETGPLCQIDWYAISGVDLTISTLEIVEEG